MVTRPAIDLEIRLPSSCNSAAILDEVAERVSDISANDIDRVRVIVYGGAARVLRCLADDRREAPWLLGLTVELVSE